MTLPIRLIRLIVALAAALALAACGQQTDHPAPQPAAPGAGKPAVQFHDAKADGTLRQRRAAFQQAVTAVLKQPDAAALATVQQDWSALYKSFNRHYLRLAVRACALGKDGLMAQLDSWPFYPAYVDSLPAWPDSGIVNDPTLHLDAKVLRQQQGVTDDGEIALGFQPLWLLLAGVKAAPRRPHDLLAAVNENIERRRAYVTLAAAQLEHDLSVLGTQTSQSSADVRCALSLLDDRLTRLADNHDANDPANGLYVAAHSVAILDATQPASALAQLAGDNNADLRAAMEASYPGFQTALNNAVKASAWKPISAWLKPSDDPASPRDPAAGEDTPDGSGSS